MITQKPDLNRFFNPRSIAVVGASPVQSTGRFEHTKWLTDANFNGPLYPVNPRYDEVYGHKCYASLTDIPGNVDLAILMVPGDKCVEVLRQTPVGKLKFAVVITSGFSEIGEIELERELIAVAHSKGIRVVGPNCMGIYCRKSRLTQTPDQPFGPGPGELAAASQSGGNSVNFVRACIDSGVLPNCSVSIGNQSDLRLEDYLEYFAADDDVKVIAGYIEDFKNGRRFLELAKEISVRKPIILWKGGVTPQGSLAATSHTGALALSNEIWEGVIRQAGIIPSDNAFDVLNYARAYLWGRLPQGPGVGLMAPGGGSSVYLTDRSIQAGLKVPRLPAGTRKKLSTFIAKVNTIIDNPIDLGAASYLPETLNKTIKTMAQVEDIHSFIIYHHVYPYKNSFSREISKEFLFALSELRETVDKPIYVTLYCPFKDMPEADDARREAIGYLNKLKIPYAPELEGCVKMVKRMWDYTRYLQKQNAERVVFKKVAG